MPRHDPGQAPPDSVWGVAPQRSPPRAGRSAARAGLVAEPVFPRGRARAVDAATNDRGDLSLRRTLPEARPPVTLLNTSDGEDRIDARRPPQRLHQVPHREVYVHCVAASRDLGHAPPVIRTPASRRFTRRSAVRGDELEAPRGRGSLQSRSRAAAQPCSRDSIDASWAASENAPAPAGDGPGSQCRRARRRHAPATTFGSALACDAAPPPAQTAARPARRRLGSRGRDRAPRSRRAPRPPPPRLTTSSARDPARRGD